MCAFCVAFVIIVTFSQAPFKEPVPAMIFSYQTPAISLYWYVIGALGLGLILGIVIAVYYYIVFKITLFKKNKQLRELEEKITELENAPNKEGIGLSPEIKSAQEELL